jgi:hypothetical protein
MTIIRASLQVATMTTQPARDRADDDVLIDLLTRHRWDQKTRSCACGWTQKHSMPRGQEQKNHPGHVANALTAEPGDGVNIEGYFKALTARGLWQPPTTEPK